MHELGLAKELWKQAEALRRQRGAVRVVSLRVGVGELSGVEPELLDSAFTLLAETGQAEPAVLEWERVPLEARCDGCATEFPVRSFRFVCPVCAEPRVSVVRGDRLILQEVKLEPGED
jgi:hydrogenase nickel incorporation protein HypA/HybF